MSANKISVSRKWTRILRTKIECKAPLNRRFWLMNIVHYLPMKLSVSKISSTVIWFPYGFWHNSLYRMHTEYLRRKQTYIKWNDIVTRLIIERVNNNTFRIHNIELSYYVNENAQFIRTSVVIRHIFATMPYNTLILLLSNQWIL